MTPRLWKAGATHAVLITLVLLITFPVVYAVIVSTLSFQQAYVYPPRLVPGTELWHNMVEAWNRVNMGRVFFVTSVISVGTAVVKIVLSLMAAFAYTHFRFRGRALLFPMTMVTQMLPLPVRILPTYEMMASFHWINSYSALMFPFFASTTGILLFRQFFLTVPRDMTDAARMDGAGPLRYFLDILVPALAHQHRCAVRHRVHLHVEPVPVAPHRDQHRGHAGGADRDQDADRHGSDFPGVERHHGRHDHRDAAPARGADGVSQELRGGDRDANPEIAGMHLRTFYAAALRTLHYPEK